MNLLWPDDAVPPVIREAVNIHGRRGGKLARQAMLIKAIASMNGGTPARGMAFAVGGDLVLWKPDGEVVTVERVQTQSAGRLWTS